MCQQSFSPNSSEKRHAADHSLRHLTSGTETHTHTHTDMLKHTLTHTYTLTHQTLSVCIILLKVQYHSLFLLSCKHDETLGWEEE